ncbi:MAG: hypothetical protein AAGG44_02810, partial [Planctomycetota bacterium]
MRVFLFALCFLSLATVALGCPFCTALAPSLREELSQYDFIATAVCKGQSDSGSDRAVHDFRIAELLQVPSAALPTHKAQIVGSVVKGYSNEAIRSGEQALM